MGNPWAPPDQSQPPGQRAPEQHAPTAPDGVGRPADAGPGPHGPHHAGPGPHGPHHSGPGPHAPGPLPPGPPGPQGPQGPPPDPAGVVRATRTSAWSAGALLGGLLLSAAPYPAMFLAPAAALAGFVLAIVAVVRATRARGRGPVLVLPVVLLVSSLAWAGISAQTLLYVDATRSFQQCRSAALTHQAQRECAVQLENDMRDRMGSLLEQGGLPTGP